MWGPKGFDIGPSSLSQLAHDARNKELSLLPTEVLINQQRGPAFPNGGDFFPICVLRRALSPHRAGWHFEIIVWIEKDYVGIRCRFQQLFPPQASPGSRIWNRDGEVISASEKR